MIDCQLCEWWDDLAGCPFCDGCEYQEQDLSELCNPDELRQLDLDAVSI